MGSKGMNLDEKALGKAAFIVNLKIKDNIELNEDTKRICHELKELMEGGRGDLTIEAIDSVIERCDREIIADKKIASFLNNKLGKVMEALKDNDDIKGDAEKLMSMALATTLSKA